MAWPFVVDTFNQEIDVVEQDTTEEVATCVYSIVICPVGACPELPGFGVTDLSFSQVPVNTKTFEADIVNQEPRATAETVSQVTDNLQNAYLTIDVKYPADTSNP